MPDLQLSIFSIKSPHKKDSKTAKKPDLNSGLMPIKVKKLWVY